MNLQAVIFLKVAFIYNLNSSGIIVLNKQCHSKKYRFNFKWNSLNIKINESDN